MTTETETKSAERWHGTAGGYTNHRCRCTACTGAWAEALHARRLKRKASVRRNGLPKSVAHGNSAYVNWGCRCEACTAAHAAQQRRWARRS